MSDPGILWQQHEQAGVALREYVATAGALDVGRVMYDGSNRFWVWSSPLADDAWGYGTTAEGAQSAFEAWLATWLTNFASFLSARAARDRN